MEARQIVRLTARDMVDVFRYQRLVTVRLVGGLSARVTKAGVGVIARSKLLWGKVWISRSTSAAGA